MFKESIFIQLATFLCLSGLYATTPFWPNDPYFNPGTQHGTEPGFTGQWHLYNQLPITDSNAGLDVNILGAWAMGYTGAGVSIFGFLTLKHRNIR